MEFKGKEIIWTLKPLREKEKSAGKRSMPEVFQNFPNAEGWGKRKKESAKMEALAKRRRQKVHIFT